MFRNNHPLNVPDSEYPTPHYLQRVGGKHFPISIINEYTWWYNGTERMLQQSSFFHYLYLALKYLQLYLLVHTHRNSEFPPRIFFCDSQIVTNYIISVFFQMGNSEFPTIPWHHFVSVPWFHRGHPFPWPCWVPRSVRAPRCRLLQGLNQHRWHGRGKAWRRLGNLKRQKNKLLKKLPLRNYWDIHFELYIFMFMRCWIDVHTFSLRVMCLY